MRLFTTVIAIFFVASLAALSAPGAKPTRLSVSSSAFVEGAVVPKLHTGDGKDVSPALTWSGVPQATKTLALTVEDPDAPGGTWFHWIIFNIPAGEKGLKENIAKTPSLPNGATQGRNDFEQTGYNGPAPPKGPPHHYQFKLVALDTKLALKPNCSKSDYYKAIQGHVLAAGTLTGTYSRK